MDDSDWLEIARLGRVRGLRGELFAQGDQTPEWYMALPEVRVRLSSGAWFGSAEGVEARALKISDARLYSGRLVLRFSGLESATEATPLVSGVVLVSRQVRPPAPEGEMWLSDLVGCAVEDIDSARLLGQVTGWQDYGGPFVTLEVEAAPGEAPILIPFVKSICKDVDLAGRKIRIDPPEGLLDLNAGPSGGPGTERE